MVIPRPHGFSLLKVVLSQVISVSMVSGASAQSYVPSGCFVTDVERLSYFVPPTCFNEARFAIVPYSQDSGYTSEQILTIYGFQFGSQVNSGYDTFYNWQSAEQRANENQSASNTHYGWYLAEFNRGKKLKALESKLRRACGSKCKKFVTVKTLNELRNKPEPSIITREADQPVPANYQEYISKGKERLRGE